MVSTLDRLGLLVATHLFAGERADNALYIPAIQQVSQSLDQPGMLYVGDCKMGALATQAFLEKSQDTYRLSCCYIQ
jgi:transposase